MATFLPNVTDVFAGSSDFDPDFNRIERMLRLRENMYQQGAKKVKGLYDSLFNSALLRGDNIQNRDAYLKTISESLNKISGMDLSLPQNVNMANILFDPLLNDPNLVKDISYTKTYQNELANADQLRTSTDPEKYKMYWDVGVRDLQYQAEDFKNADKNDALAMQSPKYVPRVDLVGMSEKLWNDSKISVKEDKISNGYIWTMKNGQIAIPLAQSFVSTMFSQDPAISEMLRTQARVARKDYIKQNASRFGGDEYLAEKDYFETVLQNEAVKNSQILNQEHLEIGKVKRLVDDWEDMNRKGKILKGSDEERKYEEAKEKLKIMQNAYDVRRKNTLDLELADVKDIKQFRNIVDGHIALYNQESIASFIANRLAYKNAETTVKVDPYSLADFKRKIDIQLEGIRQAGRVSIENLRSYNQAIAAKKAHEYRMEEIGKRAQSSKNKKATNNNTVDEMFDVIDTEDIPEVKDSTTVKKPTPKEVEEKDITDEDDADEGVTPEPTGRQ